MKSFYAFDTKVGIPQRLAFINDKLVAMTEGDSLIEIEKWSDYIYLGEKGDVLHPLTIMCLFCNMSNTHFWEFERDVDNLVSRFKKWGLRCDPDCDICEMRVRMVEDANDEWTIEIDDAAQRIEILYADSVSEEYGKQLARKVIEAAIALGVDLRTSWEVRRLENVTETKDQKQDE